MLFILSTVSLKIAKCLKAFVQRCTYTPKQNWNAWIDTKSVHRRNYVQWKQAPRRNCPTTGMEGELKINPGPLGTVPASPRGQVYLRFNLGDRSITLRVRLKRGRYICRTLTNFQFRPNRFFLNCKRNVFPRRTTFPADVKRTVKPRTFA